MKKKKIKILHVAQAAGGVDRYIRMLLKYLDKEKFENILVCSQDFREKGATTTRPSNLADTYYNTYTANTGVTLNRSLYDVHHIRPLAYGGSNAYSNLIHLPKATHTQVTSWWAGY